MSPTATLALTAAVVFLGAYAALSALTWLRRLMGERPARRSGMLLNLARRAGPPVLAGAAVLVVGRVLGAATGLPAALLVAGGLAFGLHRGLAEIRQGDWRGIAIRVALSVAAVTGYLWLAGLADGAAPV
jgi:hypothetical protein